MTEPVQLLKHALQQKTEQTTSEVYPKVIVPINRNTSSNLIAGYDIFQLISLDDYGNGISSARFYLNLKRVESQGATNEYSVSTSDITNQTFEPINTQTITNKGIVIQMKISSSSFEGSVMTMFTIQTMRLFGTAGTHDLEEFDVFFRTPACGWIAKN